MEIQQEGNRRPRAHHGTGLQRDTLNGSVGRRSQKAPRTVRTRRKVQNEKKNEKQIYTLIERSLLNARTVTGSGFQLFLESGNKGFLPPKCMMKAAAASFSCIPRRSGSREAGPFHKGYYRKRHHVENFFQRIKRCRRVSTRYDKLADVFFNFILLAESPNWIRSF